MFKIKGFDELNKNLEKLSGNAKRLHGENRVTFAELFTVDFMETHTNFLSIEDLLKAGNFVVNSQQDFEDIPEDLLDKHIRSVTQFSSWQKMLEAASVKWAKKELFK